MRCLFAVSSRFVHRASLTVNIDLSDTGIIPFSDCGEFAASLVSGVVSFMVEGRVGSVKG